MSYLAVSRSSVKHLLIVIVCLIIGGIFFVSGLLKVINPEAFRKTLSTHGLFSTGTIHLISLVLPYVEIAVGLLFALGFKLKVTGGIVICLLILFTIEGSFAYALSTAVDCGCFSTEGGGEPIGVKFFFRNGLLILFSLWVTEGESKPSSDSNEPFGWSKFHRSCIDGRASQNLP
jgi:uncharacterized membrane protein YphA (DoxX/SURF4 family)